MKDQYARKIVNELEELSSLISQIRSSLESWGGCQATYEDLESELEETELELADKHLEIATDTDQGV